MEPVVLSFRFFFAMNIKRQKSTISEVLVICLKGDGCGVCVCVCSHSPTFSFPLSSTPLLSSYFCARLRASSHLLLMRAPSSKQAGEAEMMKCNRITIIELPKAVFHFIYSKRAITPRISHQDFVT